MNIPPNKRTIVITIEGLSTSLVGAYGSNTAVTPALDAMASRGIVLDQCFLDARNTSAMLRSLWTGQHALVENCRLAMTIWNILSDSGGFGSFTTDCLQAAEAADQAGCEDVFLVDFPEANEPAGEVASCTIAEVLGHAAQRIAETSSESAIDSALYWIHTRGFRLPWDAPIELRAQFADTDDPRPPEEVEPPAFEITGRTDPDLVVGWGQVAAAQAAAFDMIVGMLQSYLDQLGDNWAWCVMGLGGVPLGEHGWVGWGRPSLHCEELQVPAIILPASKLPVGTRRAELSQLPDLGATIADLCGLTFPNAIWGRSHLTPPSDNVPFEWPAVDQMVGLVEQSTSWIRVPAWSLMDDDSHRGQLFVKPDDRWEVNDVSNRCGDIVDGLRQLGHQFFEAARNGNRNQLPKLDEAFCNLLR